MRACGFGAARWKWVTLLATFTSIPGQKQCIDQQLALSGNIARAQGTSKDHMVYVPDASIGLQESITRAASMVCALPYWNLSVVLPGELDSAEIAGLVRVTTSNMRLILPFLTAHRDALFRGLPLTKTMTPLPEDEEEETLTQVRSQKQSVLYPHAAVPGALVVRGVKAKAATTASTRGGRQRRQGRGREGGEGSTRKG